MARYGFVALLVSAALCCCSATPAGAHDVIPPALLRYVEQHPQATDAQVMAFAQAQAPEFAQKFEDGAELLQVIRANGLSPLANALRFARLGVLHILSGPDHILFVLSLLLVFSGMKEVLRLTAAFTVAHSTTLLLAGAGLITLSPRITEPLIALSIVYVALTSVFLARSSLVGSERAKLASVFFFGLFHGLGFAGLLTEVQVPVDKFVPSLLSFNVGIELGQLLIVGLALPLILRLKDRRHYTLAMKYCGAAIAGLAMFWMIQRIWFTLPA